MSAYIQAMAYLQELAEQIAAHVRFEPAIIWLLATITTGAPQCHNQLQLFEIFHFNYLIATPYQLQLIACALPINFTKYNF